jgi:hypothetical protein
MEHLATVELMPDPSSDERDRVPQGLEIELMRDRSILIIKTPDQKSFQLDRNAIERLISALQRGLRSTE